MKANHTLLAHFDSLTRSAIDSETNRPKYHSQKHSCLDNTLVRLYTEIVYEEYSIPNPFNQNKKKIVLKNKPLNTAQSESTNFSSKKIRTENSQEKWTPNQDRHSFKKQHTGSTKHSHLRSLTGISGNSNTETNQRYLSRDLRISKQLKTLTDDVIVSEFTLNDEAGSFGEKQNKLNSVISKVNKMRTPELLDFINIKIDEHRSKMDKMQFLKRECSYFNKGHKNTQKI